MSKKFHITLVASVATILSATTIATPAGAAPALIGTIVPGCLKPSLLPNGVHAIVIRNGKAYFSDDPVICGETNPPPRNRAKARPASREPMSGAIHNSRTNKTTTMIAGRNGRVSTVDDGKVDRLGDKPHRTKSGRASGTSYNPDTGKTTTASAGPGGAASTVEKGNTMKRHNDDVVRRKPLNGAYGSIYNPETNTTTSMRDGPGGTERWVDEGYVDRFGGR
jgi:hypothetical protein